MTATLVIIPTFNEKECLTDAVVKVLAATPPEVHLLVVDDESPDGTGDIADALAQRDDRVHVLHRTGRRGLGPAYLAGFAWAFERGYDAVVEMDADGSHRAAHLPRLLAGLDEHDVVLGSRWVDGGRVEHWPLRRHLLSRGGNRYARWALRLQVRDVTGGYRAMRSDALRRVPLTTVSSQGYCFQVDLLRRLVASGASVTEMPIIFTDRERGTSKMSSRIVVEAMVQVTRWGARLRAAALRRAVRDLLGGRWSRTA